jgi:serine/threonine protein kinase
VQGKLIGQGSFGSVYLGIDLHTGKEVGTAAATSFAASCCCTVRSAADADPYVGAVVLMLPG